MRLLAKWEWKKLLRDWKTRVLLIGFFINVIIGIGADVHNGKRQFNIKKATEGMKLLMFYFIIVFFLYAITYRNPEMSDMVVSWLTYIVSYFYLTNIFRNAKKIFPKTQSIKFIYEFLSTEIFYRLKDYIGWKPREEGNHENK